MSTTAVPKPPAQTFLTFVEAVDDGRLAAEATERLEGLVGELRAIAQMNGMKPRGRITIEINVEALPGGTLMSVIGDVKVKMPRRPKAASTFWPTKYNCLSPMNPDQLAIPGIDVSSPRAGELRAL